MYQKNGSFIIPKKEANHCSRQCANSRNVSGEMAEKIKNSIIEYNEKNGTSRPVAYCAYCGKKLRNYKNKNCIECTKKIKKDGLQKRTLEEEMKRRGANERKNVYQGIRNDSRKKMLNSEIEKKCFICGYDKHVEVCHIKPINSFELGSMIEEINDFGNLMFLRPNHHWEIDNGILEIQTAGKAFMDAQGSSKSQE